MATTIRPATSADAPQLHVLAAATFPLACPPDTTRASIDDFIARHLSVASFRAYLADDARRLLVAEVDMVPAGYTMLVFGEPADPDASRAISVRPTVELSKFYVLPDHHGWGVAVSLMTATIEVARSQGAAGMWLGVNQENQRAGRFYQKSGFLIVGTKRFRVGDRLDHDHVRELVL